MIKSRSDYHRYLEADRLSLEKGTFGLKAFLVDDIWKYQRLMRRLEYLTNCGGNRLLVLYFAYVYRRKGRKLGFSIPINVFGPGLSIAHAGTIVISHGAKVGANCRLHVCTNLGTEAGQSRNAPVIGDNCYIAPGVKMFGAIELGPNMAVGANAVVNKSFVDGNATIGGIPAKVISDRTSEGLLVRGWSE